MSRWLILAALALAAGCSETAEDRAQRQKQVADREMIIEAKWRLEQAARNPDSARTREVHMGALTYAGQKVVCGEFNGQNGFGGMSGFQRFMMIGGKVPLLDGTGKDGDFFDGAWREAGC